MSERLVREFHLAAQFLIERIRNDGWIWSSNFLREYVRCKSGLKFSNTISPDMLREVARRYPEIRPYIIISTRKRE